MPITSPLLYSAGHTDDTRLALRYIAHKYPDAPLLGVGFSLGSNVITRYLAEEGEDSKLHSACALACVGLSYTFLLAGSMANFIFISLGISKKITKGM